MPAIAPPRPTPRPSLVPCPVFFRARPHRRPAPPPRRHARGRRFAEPPLHGANLRRVSDAPGSFESVYDGAWCECFSMFAGLASARRFAL